MLAYQWKYTWEGQHSIILMLQGKCIATRILWRKHKNKQRGRNKCECDMSQEVFRNGNMGWTCWLKRKLQNFHGNTSKDYTVYTENC